jgi:hypothetical protein
MLGRTPVRKTPPPLAIRLLWFVGLWLAGVATLGLIALLIRTALSL